MLVPIVIVGYQCAYWNMNGKIPTWFEGNRRIPLAIFTILVVMLLCAIRFQTFGYSIQAFYIPFFIFAVVGIVNSTMAYRTKNILHKIGDLSMYIWFFHPIFITETVNTYTRGFIFGPIHNFIYTFLLTLILSYVGSYVIKSALSPIIQRIK
jgi:hypothetical protein